MQKVKAFTAPSSEALSAAPPFVPNTEGSKVLWMTRNGLAEATENARMGKIREVSLILSKSVGGD